MQTPVHAVTVDDPLPQLRTAIPGPRSRELGARLARVESRAITRVDERGPIFWAEASGSTIRDVDGNRFIDLTAGFGVAAAGHANADVARAVADQVHRLPHALGDVHPAELKVELLEHLARLAPGDLSRGILAANGSDAVEAALKTATLATGRPGIVAFEGGYHGLGYGALAVTHADRFRAPFRRQLYQGVRFAPFPSATAVPGNEVNATTGQSLEVVRHHVLAAQAGADPVGAIIVEPIQGRGGIIVPPDDFLAALRSLCDELGLVLILDEIYTGLGRTGRWFACEHHAVVPDILVLGKALAGGLPLSIALGTPPVMDAWPASEGEAIHTSTFLGNPVTCAAALAQLNQIDHLGLVGRAATLGERMVERFGGWVAEGLVSSTRGRGLMQAVVPSGPAAAARAEAASADALQHGVIVLSEGDAVAFTPPLVITEAQLDMALDVVERSLIEG